MESQSTLPVIVAPEPEAPEAAKGLFRRSSTEGIVKQIPVEQLQRELGSLTQRIGQMLDQAPAEENGGLRLTELAVQVEITASGGINLIGTANVGATASMTLTFSR